jgi:hypothetical protein
VGETIVVAKRFRGPEGSGNGGYTCGLLAELHGGRSPEVTLRLPPPLERELDVVREERRLTLQDGDALVAECVDGEVALDPPAPLSLEEAEQAASRYEGFERHAFPTCFVCGPERSAHDGLRIFAGPVEGREGIVAAPWTPDSSLADGDVLRPEFVWATLDCPGAFAVGFAARGETVLGRFTADVRSLPQIGKPHVVVGWPLGEDGRKLSAGTALFDARGELLAVARATWIVPRGG